MSIWNRLRVSSTKPITLAVIVLSAWLICPRTAFAELASEDEMKQVCQNWITYIISQTGDWAGSSDPEITDIKEIIENDTVMARIYHISSGGYVVVPVLKELPPVKVYSEEYTLDIYEADGFAKMLREVLQDRLRLFVQFHGSLETAQPVSDEALFGPINRIKWDQLAVPPDDYASNQNKNPMDPMQSVGPLLTTAWHQGYPYNNLCPMGDGDRCVVGCVATAAAQIAYYHQWPPNGTGSHSYTWGGDNSCGGSTPPQVLSADFSDAYAYDGSNAAVAELSYEMGVAFEMDYGACGSGAYTMYGAYVYPTYFNYDESAVAVYRDENTAYSWFNLVKNEINQGRPTLYRIHSHAIVCDGWRISGSLDQYHFNYGWGGSQNAWYTVDNLYCPWSGCSYLVESMVINIIPKTGIPYLGGNEFSDDSPYGDGDGIPEGGETIQLTFTVANYGGDSVTDVSANLIIDDASLTITDGYAYLGTIPARDSVSNNGDPMFFDIPIDYTSRIDSFLLEISSNGGARLDTLVIEKAIGETTIFLVDDDNNGNVDSYYRECFENFRVPYDVWIHAAYTSPDAAKLSEYDIVFWFTGDYRADPLNANEIAAMKGYLDNGGNLLVTGQAIASELSWFDVDFLNNYLKSEYQSTLMVPVLQSVEGGQVFDTGILVAIYGSGGANNQEYPNLIDTVGGGIAELVYAGQEYYGGVSYSGAYKSLFFSFGFEAIVSGDSRWQDRDTSLSDILDFFGYLIPNPLPLAYDLVIGPGDPIHMADHNPQFSWNYHDAGAAPQSNYQVQVGDDNTWDEAEMWDTGPISGDDTQITYAGLEMADGNWYYIRVRVFNGTYWSDWCYSELRMNSLPPMPTELTPSDMQGAADLSPDLSHSSPIDGEYDVVTYSYEVYDDPELTTLVASADDQPWQYEVTTWTVPETLTEDDDYYWRVRANDPYEDGYWTDPAAFWVNADNQLPGPFDLVSPADEAHIVEFLPTMSWTASGDADPYDQIRYSLYYSINPDFTYPTTIMADLENTECALTDSLEYGTLYYWKVVVQDQLGAEITSSSIFTFSTLALGDANSDGMINVADAVYLINYVFKDGSAPVPLLAGDANCDGASNIADAVYIINYVFKDGPEPGCP